MSPARTVAIALTAAVLAAPAGALGQGSGAGDDQYADPFEDAPAQTRTPSTTGSQADGLSESPDLGMDPDTSGDDATTTPPGTTGNDDTTTPPGTLPNTGSDPRLVVLAGLALLLTGLGLRLRTADEVF